MSSSRRSSTEDARSRESGACSLGAGEIDLTAHLPVGQPFRLRVTALDLCGVGRVGDVFLALEPSGQPISAADGDLRTQQAGRQNEGHGCVGLNAEQYAGLPMH